MSAVKEFNIGDEFELPFSNGRMKIIKIDKSLGKNKWYYHFSPKGALDIDQINRLIRLGSWKIIK